MSKWISVDDKLPEKGDYFFQEWHASDDVLITDGFNMYVGHIRYSNLNGFKHQWVIHGRSKNLDIPLLGITHWQKLPEYPKSKLPKEAGYYWTKDKSGAEQIGYWSPSKQHLMLLGSDPYRNGLEDGIVKWTKVEMPRD